MKIAIAVCILATICGLTVAGPVKKYANPQTNNFDVLEAQQNVKKKMQELLLDRAIDWQRANLILMLTHDAANRVFATKLTREREGVGFAVEYAKKKGKNAEHCIDIMEDKFKALEQHTKTKLTQCINSSTDVLTEGYNATGKVMKAGREALDQIQEIYNECQKNKFDLKECVDAGSERARLRVESFNKKLKLHPTSGKLLFDQMTDKFVQCLSTNVTKALEELSAIKLISRICVNGSPQTLQ